MGYSRALVDAFAMAHELHRDQRLKGANRPYLAHLMDVAALVAGYDGDEEQVIAALLHDAVEDQGGRPVLDRIRDRFGERVAAYVECCSDTDQTPKPPWRERKAAFIARAGAFSPEVRLIVAADKLANVRSMIRDYRQVGDRLWERFNGGRDGTLWYHEELLAALERGWAHPMLELLRDAIRGLRRVCADA